MRDLIAHRLQSQELCRSLHDRHSASDYRPHGKAGERTEPRALCGHPSPYAVHILQTVINDTSYRPVDLYSVWSIGEKVLRNVQFQKRVRHFLLPGMLLIRHPRSGQYHEPASLQLCRARNGRFLLTLTSQPRTTSIAVPPTIHPVANRVPIAPSATSSMGRS